jgi:hypothetical protein
MISLFSRFKSRKIGKTPPVRRHGYRPCVELLETREVLSTFFHTVTNTSGSTSTVGSLPWAVNQANYVTHGLNYINFNIPGAGQHVINLSQTLYINDQVVIDGTTQPGYNGGPLICIQGNAAVPSLLLLQSDPSQGVSSSGSTIQGLDLYNYTANGITILNSSQGDWIQKNWIGFYNSPTGGIALNSSLYNFTSSIGIQSSFNTIRFNTLDGGYNAIVMGEDPLKAWSGTVYKTNAIQYNFIGTNPGGTSTAGFGNTSDAIFLGAGAEQNFLGPTNVLSGNQINAVEFLHSSNIGNVLFASFIGTNMGGTVALGNGHLGVLIAGGAHGNEVGGPWGGNVIDGNSLGGISLGTSGYGNSVQNFVQGNIIGLNGSQTAVIGAQNVGISIQSGSTGNLVSGNVLAGAIQHGVVVASATSNGINNNWIGESVFGGQFANGAFGIALLPGASFNFVLGNAFGTNRLGPYYIDGQAAGNAIG